MVQADETVAVGAVVGTIDTSVEAPAGSPVEDKPVEKVKTDTPTAKKDLHPDLKNTLSPATSRVVNERGLDPSKIEGSGKDGRLTKGDALSAVIPGPDVKKGDLSFLENPSEQVQRREKMSRLRKRIAERLVGSQHETASLTTFNEIDMHALTVLKKKYNDDPHGYPSSRTRRQHANFRTLRTQGKV